jgi:hypothetical protein
MAGCMTRDESLPEFDDRPSIRLTNTAPEHPKIVGLSDAAFRLWVELICYCSRQETDGKVTAAAMRRAGKPKVVAELLETEVLEQPNANLYLVHDYLRHQRSAAEIESFRESKAESGAKGAHMRWHVPRRQRVKDCPYCLQDVANA